jgi:hypothetical protein
MSQPNRHTGESGVPDLAVPFERSLSATVPGYFRYSQQLKGKLQMVIRDPATWADIWCRLRFATTVPREPAPSIDFEREMLIVVGVGRRTDGYTAEIDSIVISEGQLIVRYRTGFDFGESLTDGFSDPVIVVRVPRDDSHPIAFVDVTSDLP